MTLRATPLAIRPPRDLDEPSACPVCDRENCDEHQVSSKSVERRRLVVARAVDVISAPRAVEIVEGLAYADCLSVLVSESGTGKTFVLLDLASAISDGVSWCGRHVTQGAVLYLSFEGDALGTRLRALREHIGRRLDHLYIVRASDPLSPVMSRESEQRSTGEVLVADAIADIRDRLRAAGDPPVRLVIVDTVRASLSGSEDNSADVAGYLRAVRRLLAITPGAAGLLAHHAGWQDGEQKRRRERGSSAWRGNCDVTLYLEAGDYDAARGVAPLTLTALKVRDAERPAPLHLLRRRVELAECAGDDLRAGAVTSCIIEPDRRTGAERVADHNHASDAAARVFDRRLLTLIADRPDVATSQDRIRVALNVRKAQVSESVGRCIRAGWLSPSAGKGQPHTLTPDGRELLKGEAL